MPNVASSTRRPASRRLIRGVMGSKLLAALTYPHGVDRYAELVSPLALTEAVRAEVVEVDRQTPKSVTLTLRPNSNWRGHRAGQFVGVGVEVAGVRLTRPYSPAGPEQASAERLELTISTHPEGRVSRHLRDHARTGMVVDLTQAQGDFVLPDERPESVLLISGGSGITPVMAILRTLCEEGFDGEIGFLNYARSAELALYEPELARMVAVHPRLTVARAFTTGVGAPLSGRFRREHLQRVTDSHGSASTFVCGPPALIEGVRELWEQDGLPQPAVETFTAPALAPDTSCATGLIRFERSGVQAPNSGLALLEQAEDAGLAPEHGCRMGICNTCSARKRSGSVRNLITGEISSNADEDIRICISAPVGDVALDL